MFNISFSEFIVILLLAFIILGPDEMGKVARFCGKAVREGRKYMYRIKEYVNEETAGTGLDDVKDAVSDLNDTLRETKKTLSGADLKEAVGDLAAKPAVKTEPAAKQKKTDQTDTSEKSDHAESEKKEK